MQLLAPISIYVSYISILISIFIYFIFISSLCCFITLVSLFMLYYFLVIRLELRFLIYFFLTRNLIGLFLLYFLIFVEISYDLVIVLFVFVMFLTIAKRSIIFYVSSLSNSIIVLSNISLYLSCWSMICSMLPLCIQYSLLVSTKKTILFTQIYV